MKAECRPLGNADPLSWHQCGHKRAGRKAVTIDPKALAQIADCANLSSVLQRARRRAYTANEFEGLLSKNEIYSSRSAITVEALTP
jgi:hypothetical protein